MGPHFFVFEPEYVLLSNLSQPTVPQAGLEFRNGKLEWSTANFNEQHTEELLKSGPIRFSAVDAVFEHIVTVGEDKKLKVWELDEQKLCSERSVITPLPNCRH